MNSKWDLLNEQNKLRVLNAAVAYMQYFAWNLVFSLKQLTQNSSSSSKSASESEYDPIETTSGACMTAFIPGYPKNFFIQLGDSIAVDLNTKDTTDLMPSITPAHHIKVGQGRLVLGLNMLRSFGDLWTVKGYRSENGLFPPDSNFSIQPDIVTRDASEPSEIMLATDALTENDKRRKPPITLKEATEIIKDARSSSPTKDPTNPAEAVAREVFPQHTGDDTSVILFNSASAKRVLAVIDGHGFKSFGHCTANNVKDNFCFLLNNAIEMQFNYWDMFYTLTLDTASDVTMRQALLERLAEVDPTQFGNWSYYRQDTASSKGKNFAQFDKLFEALFAKQEKALREIQQEFQPSSQTSVQTSAKTKENLGKIQQKLFAFANEQLGYLRRFKERLADYKKNRHYQDKNKVMPLSKQTNLESIQQIRKQRRQVYFSTDHFFFNNKSYAKHRSNVAEALHQKFSPI